MKVKEAMCNDVQLIDPNTTLREAAQKMRDSGCGYLPIGENDRLKGAITDRDIVVRGIAENANPDDDTVNSAMSENIVYCYEDDDIKDAAKKMQDKQIRRLVVLNQKKRMVGILSIGDIARTCNDKQLTGDIEHCLAKAA